MVFAQSVTWKMARPKSGDDTDFLTSVSSTATVIGRRSFQSLRRPNSMEILRSYPGSIIDPDQCCGVCGDVFDSAQKAIVLN